MTTIWPRGNIEQELYVRSLERQVARLTHTRQSIVLHSIVAPTRKQWESAYRDQYDGDVPIPPGMRLCWLDMRNGIIRQYMTTFDRENGTASSGEIYAAVRNQIGSHIRFIGNMTVDGRAAPASVNSPDIVIGSDLAANKRKGLLMLELFFRYKHRYANDGTRIWLDFGTTVVEPEMVSTGNNDISRLHGRGASGVLSAAQAFDNNFPQESTMLASIAESPDPTNGATAFPAMLCHMQLFNPFGFLNGDNEFRQDTNVVGMGTFYHFPNNYIPSSGTTRQGSMSHFMISALHPMKLGKNWRINFRKETGSARVSPIGGDGWVYGYYNTAITDDTEFVDVI
jgi:hypothetical protein